MKRAAAIIRLDRLAPATWLETSLRFAEYPISLPGISHQCKMWRVILVAAGAPAAQAEMVRQMLKEPKRSRSDI